MQPHPAALPPAIHRPPGRIFNCLLGVASHARYIGNQSLFIAGGRGAAAAAEEDLRLNKMKFGRSPLWMLFHWSDPPPCLYFPSKFEWSPLWILPKFSLIPPLGSQLRLISPFLLLNIKWFPPPKILRSHRRKQWPVPNPLPFRFPKPSFADGWFGDYMIYSSLIWKKRDHNSCKNKWVCHLCACINNKIRLFIWIEQLMPER